MAKSLCKLVKGKKVRKDPDAYIKLVKSPKFICLKCGRAAKDKKYLCDPFDF